MFPGSQNHSLKGKTNILHGRPVFRSPLPDRESLSASSLFRSVCAVLWAAALLLTCTPRLHAQAVENAQITGVITDTTGSVVPKVSIAVTNLGTGVARRTVSGPDGSYFLVNLAPGSYQLRASAPGFKAYIQNGIVLSVGSTITVSFVLPVGQVTQEVSVTADAVMVQTQDTSTSQVISNKDVLELPLNGREITSLVTLSGGAVNATNVGDVVSSKTYGSTDISGSTAISVAGGQANGVNYVLDGGDNNDNYSNVNLPLPFPDAVDEFSVQTDGLSARYGLHPGGTVNVATKSGGNQFHGDVFEFVRNGALDASNYFSASPDTLQRNQFGGVIGGPILHDRLFFFGGYQGTRITSIPQDSISYVPTQQVLTGDFSTFESAACQSSGQAKTLTNPSTGLPYPGNYINPGSFSQPALNLLKSIPVSTNSCGQLVYGVEEEENEDQYIGRLDWTVGGKQSVFGRYFTSRLNNPPPPLTNLLYTGRAGLDDVSQTLTLGDTYSLSPTLVNALHITGTKLTVNRYMSTNTPNPTTEGIDVSTVVPNFIYMTISSFFSLGCGSCAPGVWASDGLQAADDVDKMMGRHHLSFGFNWIYDQLNYSNSYLGNGEWTFTGQFTGSALADFLLGDPNVFTQANAVVAYPRQTYIGAYAEDDWTLSPKLTAHLGLRWEPLLPAADKQSEIDHFDAVNFASGTTSAVFTNAPPGEVFVGDKGVPPSFSNHKFTDFEPRIGVAWDPTGTGKESVRSAYSVFYDYPELNYSTHPGQGAPWGSTVSLSAPADGLANPYSGYPGGNPFPTPIPPPSGVSFVHYGAYYNIPVNIHPTYVQEWTLSYQF
ncbi:MAG: TonB-dependent receptor, partial [Acidobacteriaceae bacterium]